MTWSCKSKLPKLFFQTVLGIWRKWAQISTANAAVQESQLWDCYELAHKSEAAKLCGYQFSQVYSVLCWWFDISWPAECFSSSVPDTNSPACFGSHLSFQSHECDCKTRKSMVPLLFFQAVLVIWPFVAQISTPQAAAQLASLLQMYFKHCYEPPWWEKNIVLYTWRSLVFGWNSSFAPFTIQIPKRNWVCFVFGKILLFSPLTRHVVTS